MEEVQKNKTLVIQNNIDELNRLVEFLEIMEEEWELPMGLIPSINLALEEALTNVIFYAYEKNTTNDITVDFYKQGTKLTIVITDSGTPYDPLQKEDPDLELGVEDRPIGGLGIFLIKRIMNEVSYQWIDGKNQLTLTKSWN